MQNQNHLVETVKCLSSKEIKALVRPEFQANPNKFYPTTTFYKLGFSRSRCKCGHYYWRKSQSVTNCGDAACKGKYTFIGRGCGIGSKGSKITYKSAWQSFEKSLTNSPIPCTSISRYPVIARWRNDIDYVAAGIFCFQPYCVTGELDPPANPLVCPQFCVRFNDLDNIGLTGRHFSGFIMMGIQVFNHPDKYIFFKQETVEYNYKWLTEQLGIDPQQITFVEDIWAGGGNLGPCVEYFVQGLQLGNMVFMQYKYDNQGKYDQLSVKVIDVGVGLQRIPWIINGTSTSYSEVFKRPYQFMLSQIKIELNNDIWDKLGPYTCKLDIDQTENIDKTWLQIAQIIQQPLQKVKKSILPIKELYVILDHTRTIFMIIQDGGLPSNTGGGSNCRNILRRVFALFKKNGWWGQIGELKGLLHIFQLHRMDLEEIYGPFPQYKSFANIIKIQYDRWLSTQGGQRKKLQQLLLKNKGKLSLDNWIMVMQSWGIPADAISQICKIDIPDNLYYQIANRMEKLAKKSQLMLYDTVKLEPTENLYYIDHRMYQFQATIVAVLKNVQEQLKGTNIVLLDRSAFYPTSGGQIHDTGHLIIDGTEYEVYNVEKVGKCVLHYLGNELNEQKIKGSKIIGKINKKRRDTLRGFHTGTHIVYASARRILGPHVWQHGAKKSQQYAHIDITHYSSLSKEIEIEIENEANRIILQGKPIIKYFQNKSEAQKKYGFNLYQGGIVPGNQIRIINIDGVDVEACCGTHCDNTSQVGWIKIFKSVRISDGILRLIYVAGQKVLPIINQETILINELKNLWKISQNQIVPTANRFFNDFKKYEKDNDRHKLALLNLQIKYITESKSNNKFVIVSLEKQLTLYFSNLNTNLIPILDNNKSIIFLNQSLLFAIIAQPQHLDLSKLKQLLVSNKIDLETIQKKLIVKKGIQYGKGANKKQKQQTIIVSYVGKLKEHLLLDYFNQNKFQLLK